MATSVRLSVHPPTRFTVSSPPPSARTECDLLSCKHIGSSIEKRFNKVNKSRHHSWYWGGGLQGKCGGGGEASSPSLCLLPLACSGHHGVCCHILSSDRRLQDPVSIFQPPHNIIFSHLYPPPPFTKKKKREREKGIVGWAVDSQSNGFTRPTCGAAAGGSFIWGSGERSPLLLSPLTLPPSASHPPTHPPPWP